MPQGVPFQQAMPFGLPQAQQQAPQIPQQPINPMVQALMGQGQTAPQGQVAPQGQTAPIGQIGMPNSAPPFGTPPWMRPMGR